MKKLLLLAFLFVCTMAFGQSKDSAQYAELQCSPRIFSQKYDIWFSASGTNGNTLPYAYPTDALNAYAKMGWHLVSTYVIPGNNYTLHLIIEKN